MKATQYLVTLAVAQCWIDDGYDPNNLQDVQHFIADALERRLPFADPSFELSTMIEAAPIHVPSLVVTCVYCGEEYPAGTPTSGAAELTKHISVCAKHPMREASQTIQALKESIQCRWCSEKFDDVKLLQKHIEGACHRHPARQVEKHVFNLSAALITRGATTAELSEIFNKD